MRLNLPLTLTSQKISIFLLLILFNALQLKSDEQFKDCLDKEQTRPIGGNLTGLYDTIVTFAKGHPDKTNFCCDFSLKCEVMASQTQCPNLVPPRTYNQCGSINNSKFCASYGAGPLPGGLCGGIVGNSDPIDAKVDDIDCPSYDAIRNILKDQNTVPNKFSWLCCNTDNCKVPINVEMFDPTNNSDTQTGLANCASNEYGLMCFKDTKVWTCTGSLGSTSINIWPNPIGTCLEQVSKVSSSSSLTVTITSTPSPSTNKKVILIGVLGGVIGVMVIMVIGFLAYKWRKNYKIREQQSRIINDLQATSDANTEPL